MLGRAFLRRSNLVDRPDQVLDDPEVVEHAELMRAKSIGAINAAAPTPAAAR